MADRPMHLAVALDGAGWHPAAWRRPEARPEELWSAGYWVDMVRLADDAGIDMVTIEDGLAMQSSHRDRPDDRVDQVRGRLDAVVLAARVAPTTRRVGLVPSVTATHTEPFHISKAIATLDFVSGGRAGVRVQVSGRPHEAAQFGRRPELAAGADVDDLMEEAADHIEVLRRLWDSWEDDAEIRDAASGRFVDREKLHYIDFEGRWFSVKGPSITPRSPQGQPIVAVLAHIAVVYRLAARQADVVFVTPTDGADAREKVAEVREAEAATGRPGAPLRVLGDVVVGLDPGQGRAAARLTELDRWAGRAYRSDARIVAGTASGLADLLEGWHHAGLDGFRLRPLALPHDLSAIADQLVPELRRRGLVGDGEVPSSLRARLGLERPEDRYAARPAGGAR